MAENTQGGAEQAPKDHELVECPHCHKSFWRKIKETAGEAADALGNVIGESMFGGER